MPDWHVGQRVQYRSHFENDNHMCITFFATIKFIDDENVVLEFDEYHDHAHDCDGHAKQGHGWWVTLGDLSVTPLTVTPDEAVKAFVNKHISEEQFRKLTKEGGA